MATVVAEHIGRVPTDVEVLDLGSKPLSEYREQVVPHPDVITIKQYHPALKAILGNNPHHSLLLTSAQTSRSHFFYGTCVYLPRHSELYATSRLLQATCSSRLPTILISKATVERTPSGDHEEGKRHIHAVIWHKLRSPPTMPLPAGAAAYKDGIIFCSQGVYETTGEGAAGVYYMPHGKPPRPVITAFGGRPFNSPHSVTVARDTSIWFTDSCHGFEAGIRQRPQLPNQLYRYEPDTGILRAVADGLARPAGLAFSPDEETLYVCDTDAVREGAGTADTDLTRAATIYAYDVLHRSDQPFLANRRVFAFALDGMPRDVRCDRQGNVYAACGDGVEIWSAGGVPLGVAEIVGGCSSLCFGVAGEMFVCGGQRLWRLETEIGS